MDQTPNVDAPEIEQTGGAPDLAARKEAGKSLRKDVPRDRHLGWKAPAGRRDPVDILEEQSATRIPELVPIRYGRMIQSPFSFLRGASAVMAADLSTTPNTGIRVQSCGDCHLANFGAFATPERNLAFDINDFDETLPAPWEWDLKRLAASFVVATRHNGLPVSDCRTVARRVVEGYRTAIEQFAAMRVLDMWYYRMDLHRMTAQLTDRRWRKQLLEAIQKARVHSAPEYTFPKLTHTVKGKPVIKDNPPLIYHSQAISGAESSPIVEQALRQYRESLPEDRRMLFDRFTVVDLAMKVVGVGSVGMLSMVLLMMAGANDPLFLQVKEAQSSVLEPYAGASVYSSPGQRIVTGQRIMQAVSDIFLGWTDTERRHFYVRQLKDTKISPEITLFTPENFVGYAGAASRALARAHARSGFAAEISGYMGKKEVFDDAIVQFASDYAAQTERDHAALQEAVRKGRVKALADS